GWNAVTLTMGQISPSLSIPMGYVYLSVPVSGVLIIIYSLINLIDTLSNKPAIQEKI
ncbi:TPA: TRAP transporter small permease, partial [Enterococcus faecium]